MRPRCVVVLLALLLTAGTVAPVASGATDPTVQVCPVCGPGFEAVAADHGLNVTVAESTARVQIREDGSARWTVRNRLANASHARRLADADLRPTVGRLLADHVVLDADRVRNVSTRVEGDTVVVSFTDAAAGSRRLGLTVVTYFWVEPSFEQRSYYRFRADRLTVVGPAGTRLTNAGPGGRDIDDARVEDGGRRVVWSAASGEYETTHVDAFLAFGRYTGPGSALQTDLVLLHAANEAHLGIGTDLRRIAALGFVPFALVFAATVALTGSSARNSRGRETDGPKLRAVSLALSAYPYVYLLLPGPATRTGVLTVVGATYAALVLRAWEHRSVEASRRDALAALAVVPLSALGWALFVGLDGLVLALWLTSAVAAFTLGTARTHGERLAAGSVVGLTLYAAVALVGLQLPHLLIFAVPLLALGASIGTAALYPFGASLDTSSGSRKTDSR